MQINILKKIIGHHENGVNESVYAITDAGRRRKANEDCYLILPDIGIYIVADGMGGHNAGQAASRNAVKAIGRYFNEELVHEIKEDEGKTEKEMVNAIKMAHEEILDMSRTNERYSGMGSTIVVSFVHDNVLHTCHVGDSRAYVINTSSITQVTKDHSTVAELVQDGEMTIEEARHSPLKNQITQALGASTSIEPEYNQHDLNDGDVVLLCSDGLWEMLSDQEIQAIVMCQENMKEACIELTQRANEAGGNDNITVVLVEMDVSDESQTPLRY